MNRREPTDRPERATRVESDAEIEAIVAEAIAAEAAQARREASPPSSAIVWWRAQMRARQEAAQAARLQLLWPAVRFTIGIHPHNAGTYGTNAGKVAEVVRAQVKRTRAQPDAE